MLRHVVFCVFWALSLAAPIRAADDCSEARFEETSARVKAVQSQLLADKVEEMDTSVTSSIQQQIRTMKAALTDSVNLYMECQQGSNLDTKTLEIRLAGLLGANEPKPAALTSTSPQNFPEQVQEIYGADLKLEAKRPVPTMNLIALEVSFGISCGKDTILLIYEWEDNRWRQVVGWQSDEYSKVSGAYGDFFNYEVLRRNGTDQWVVVAAHGRPWCTSFWSGFDLDVIEPENGAAPQRVLFHKHGGYYRGDDFGPVLKARSDGFELRLRDISIDFDVFARAMIYRYRLIGDTVKRVQPVAMNGRDFVDEWLRTEWDEASDWTVNGNLESLKNEHATIQKLRYPDKVGSGATLSFGAVRGCSTDPKRFQVALNLDPGGPIYFAIQEGQNSFTMLSAFNQPDPLCKGADLMGKH